MGKKITNMMDYEKNAMKKNEILLKTADRLIEWFVEPSKLFEVFSEDQVEGRYDAIPETLAMNIADIKAAKWPPARRKAIKYTLSVLDQVYAIMLQCRWIEDNDDLPELLQETLRDECVAAIDIIWLSVTGMPYTDRNQDNTGSK